MVDVTVVIPTRDRRELLGTTLDGVRHQRDVSFEVVVVDDGSADGSPEAVEALGDPRIRVLRHGTSEGVSAARNTGLAAARGEWVAFLDDDDLWSPAKLSRQLDAVARTKRDWVYAGAVSVDDGYAVVLGSPPLEPRALCEGLDRRNVMVAGASNVLMRTSFVRRVGGFDPTLRHHGDWDLWLRLRPHGLPARVCDPLVGYRLHAGNATRDPSGAVEESRRLAVEHGITPDLGAYFRWVAWLDLRSGERGRALRSYARAARFGDAGAVARELGALALGRLRPSRRSRPAGDRDEAWRALARPWLAGFPA